MLVKDVIFEWEGWGGALKLGSGRCRLRIYDLTKADPEGPAPIRPVIVLVSDVPDSPMSIRSCAGHVATHIASQFKLDYQRMLYVEYYPRKSYGKRDEHIIPERFDVVDFTWHEHRAIKPQWRPASGALLKTLKQLNEASRSL